VSFQAEDARALALVHLIYQSSLTDDGLYGLRGRTGTLFLDGADQYYGSYFMRISPNLPKFTSRPNAEPYLLKRLNDLWRENRHILSKLQNVNQAAAMLAFVERTSTESLKTPLVLDCLAPHIANTKSATHTNGTVPPIWLALKQFATAAGNFSTTMQAWRAQEAKLFYSRGHTWLDYSLAASLDTGAYWT
jgi:hypothetical protein